jgi:hypothetical protein
VRVRHAHHHRGLLHEAQARLAAAPGVRGVETNPQTGSVLVRYDPAQHSRSELLAMFEDVGIVVRETLGGLGEEVPETGRSSTSVSVISALSDLDKRIARATGHTVDLKLLFPATLGAIGIRQLFTTGLGLAEVPAYVLLWYAFDSFYKLHRMPGHEAAPPAAAPHKPVSANGASHHA